LHVQEAHFEIVPRILSLERRYYSSFRSLRISLNGCIQRYDVDQAINYSMSARGGHGFEGGLVWLRPMHDKPLGAMCR
jgi:hypothetical protein